MEQTTTWLCPVCEKVLYPDDLIVDGYAFALPGDPTFNTAFFSGTLTKFCTKLQKMSMMWWSRTMVNGIQVITSLHLPNGGQPILSSRRITIHPLVNRRLHL